MSAKEKKKTWPERLVAIRALLLNWMAVDTTDLILEYANVPWIQGHPGPSWTCATRQDRNPTISCGACSSPNNRLWVVDTANDALKVLNVGTGHLSRKGNAMQFYMNRASPCLLVTTDRVFCADKFGLKAFTLSGKFIRHWKLGGPALDLALSRHGILVLLHASVQLVLDKNADHEEWYDEWSLFKSGEEIFCCSGQNMRIWDQQVYVLMSGLGGIRVFDELDGSLLRIVELDLVRHPTGLAVSMDEMYVSDQDCVHVFARETGHWIRSWPVKVQMRDIMLVGHVLYGCGIKDGYLYSFV